MRNARHRGLDGRTFPVVTSPGSFGCSQGREIVRIGESGTHVDQMWTAAPPGLGHAGAAEHWSPTREPAVYSLWAIIRDAVAGTSPAGVG